MIYDETKNFIIKSIFYDGFGSVISIFIIEVDISSSEHSKSLFETILLSKKIRTSFVPDFRQTIYVLFNIF